MASPLLYPALAEVALITYRDVKNGSNVNNPIPHFPIPSQYVSVILVYGGLSLLPESADRLGALIGWGFVVATALNVWTPGASVITSSTGVSPVVVNGIPSTQVSGVATSGGVVSGLTNFLKKIIL